MRKVLVVVDMQNDFIDGTLGTPEAKAIVPNVLKKIRLYEDMALEAEHGHLIRNIYFTRDTHGDNYFNTYEGKNLPVKHCIECTDGWQLQSNIMEAALHCGIIVDKNTFGSFRLPKLVSLVQDFDDIEIEVIGLCTDICVVTNALILRSKFPNVPITVDSSCCAGTTPERHKAALETMQSCQIKVI